LKAYLDLDILHLFGSKTLLWMIKLTPYARLSPHTFQLLNATLFDWVVIVTNQNVSFSFLSFFFL